MSGATKTFSLFPSFSLRALQSAEAGRGGNARRRGGERRILFFRRSCERERERERWGKVFCWDDANMTSLFSPLSRCLGLCNMRGRNTTPPASSSFRNRGQQTSLPTCGHDCSRTVWSLRYTHTYTHASPLLLTWIPHAMYIHASHPAAMHARNSTGRRN